MIRPALLAALAILVSLPLGAEPKVGVAGVRILGLDLSLTDGPWRLTGGGGYQALVLGRDGQTGEPADLNGSWQPIGAASIRYTWTLDEADLWAGGGVLGWGHFGAGAVAAGLLPDQAGNTLGYGNLGLTRDRRTANAHGVVTGTFAEALVEVGPSFLAVRGTDYLKAAVRASSLLPLWDLDGPAHLFSGVLGLRAQAQWIDGRAVPILLLESTEVRGYSRAYDTRFRSVATAELRVKAPSVLGDHDLVPVVFGFVEGGWYAGYADAPAAVSDRTGWLAGAGVGFGLDVFGITTPTYTLALPLADGASGLWTKVNFNLRF